MEHPQAPLLYPELLVGLSHLLPAGTLADKTSKVRHGYMWGRPVNTELRFILFCSKEQK